MRDLVCSDCVLDDHEPCRREGGYLDQEDNSIRCACHLDGHPAIHHLEEL